VTSTPKGKAVVWILVVLALTLGVGTAYVYATLSWSYSDGERVGYVQKFSRKGYVCKTWEGELAMVAVPGSTPEKFYFTVREDAIAAAINGSLGKRVALKYEQHLGVPSTCFGETEYFVAEVKVVE
jgi:hypothetical protein